MVTWETNPKDGKWEGTGVQSRLLQVFEMNTWSQNLTITNAVVEADTLMIQDNTSREKRFNPDLKRGSTFVLKFAVWCFSFGGRLILTDDSQADFSLLFISLKCYPSAFC